MLCLQNILHTENVSILFEVPGSKTTLRCGGRAHISKNEKLLEQHIARGCKPKVVIIVQIEYAFFHCAKAYMRSQLWVPSSWPREEYKVCFGQYFTSSSSVSQKIDSGIDEHYKGIQKAIDGEGNEVEH